MDRHAHARQLGFRHGRDSRFFSGTRRTGLRVGKESGAAQLMGFTARNHAFAGTMRLKMLQHEVRTGQCVPVLYDENGSGRGFGTDIGGGGAAVGCRIVDPYQIQQRLGFIQDSFRCIGRAVVYDHDFRRDGLAAEGPQGQSQPVGLVLGSDDYAGTHGCSSTAVKTPRSPNIRTTSSATSRYPSGVRCMASTFRLSAPALAMIVSTSTNDIPVSCDRSVKARLNRLHLVA